MCTVRQLSKDIDVRRDQIEELEEMILEDLRMIREQVTEEEWKDSEWEHLYERLNGEYNEEVE